MSQPQRGFRQSISLPQALARCVQALAKRRGTSANRVIVELIEDGLEAKEREKVAFFELSDSTADLRAYRTEAPQGRTGAHDLR